MMEPIIFLYGLWAGIAVFVLVLAGLRFRHGG